MRTPARSPTRAPDDYVIKVGALDWAALATLWQNVKRRRTPGWMAGKAMEHLVLRAFQLSGADVIWPYTVNLGGQVVEQVDGMVTCNGITCMIETKDEKSDINVEPLAKLRNQLMRRPAGVVGSVFSSTGFTMPAKTLAHYMAPHAILLWQGSEVEYLIERQNFAGALKAKYHWLMQHGVPDYHAREEAIR
jgi:Restriction endonuclease